MKLRVVELLLVSTLPAMVLAAKGLPSFSLVATVIVDNVMASPVLQKPLQLGADVVMYSATKHIDGQGRVLAGAILGSASYIQEKVMPFTRHTGPALSPFNAWVLVKSLETMELRVERMVSNAQRSRTSRTSFSLSAES